MQNNVNAVFEQRRRTGRPMFPHINHPNFGWSLTAEDLVAVEGERFFEVYNGHPAVNNEGDDLRPSAERMWDIVLAERLSQGLEVMFGIATDDELYVRAKVISSRTKENPYRAGEVEVAWTQPVVLNR